MFKSNYKTTIKLCILVISLIIYIKYEWWWYGSLNDFKFWYTNFGLLIWGFKSLYLIAILILVLETLYFLINQTINSLFFSIIIITFLVGEIYPFSFYPMYNNFPNFSYVFYIEDDKGKNLKEYLLVSHAGLSHIFFAQCEVLKIQSGLGMEKKKNLETIGSKMLRRALNYSKVRGEGIKVINLKRIYNYYQKDRIFSDTTVMITFYVQ